MEYLQQFLNSTILLPTASITIMSLLLFLYHNLSRNNSKQPPPPEASGALPIIGHLHLLVGRQPAHKTLGLMADKHGPIFTVRMGVYQALVVSSWEIAKECLTTNDKVFADRPKFVASEILTYDYAMFAFCRYGPYWREIRKVATLELLSNHGLETLRHVGESEIKTGIRELYSNHNTTIEKTEIDMKKWFGEITLNVVFLDATESEDGGSDRYRKALRDFFEYMGGFILSDAVPWLRCLDLGGHKKAMKLLMKELDELAQRLLDKHKKRKKEVDTNIVSDRGFEDVMLSNLDGTDLKDSRYDDDTIIKATSLNLILAASDTTMITMTWAVALLLNNREALRKVQRELDEQVGRERQVRESDLKNLFYLKAIVKETLRLYPPGPLSVPHKSNENCTVAGHHVPARTSLLFNLSRIQRDPSVWAEPDEFRPERFLTGEGKSFDVRGQNFELIPFGSGRRMCPGISFALQVIELSLAAVLHGFEITTPRDETVDMTESAGLSNLKATPLNVLLAPRLPAEAY